MPLKPRFNITKPNRQYKSSGGFPENWPWLGCPTMPTKNGYFNFSCSFMSIYMQNIIIIHHYSRDYRSKKNHVIELTETTKIKRKYFKSFELVGKSPIFPYRIFSKPLHPSGSFGASFEIFPIFQHAWANLITFINSWVSTSFLRVHLHAKNIMIIPLVQQILLMKYSSNLIGWDELGLLLENKNVAINEVFTRN